MKVSSVKKNILYSMVYQGLIMFIPIITTPYVSRVLGAEKIGIYSYINSVQTYFIMFAALGTVSYGIREISRNRDNSYKRSKIFWEIEILTIITSIFSLALYLIYILINELDYKIYYLILILNLFNVMFDISWFFTGIEEIKYTLLKNLFFKFLGVLFLFVFIKSPADLGLYIFLMSLMTLLGTMSMWIYLPKFLIKIRLKDLKILPHLKETFVYFIPTIATTIYTVLDKTLLGIIVNNNEENGYYEQATKIIRLLQNFTFTALNMVMESRMAYLFAKGKYEEIKRKINVSINYISFLSLGIIFALFSISKRFILLFLGEGYDKSALILMVLSPLLWIIGISNCLGSQYYNPVGLRKKSSKYLIIGSIVNLFLNLILIPKYWGVGAAIATLIAETTISILYLKNSNKFLTLKIIWKASYKKFIAGAAMMIVLCILNCLKINDFLLLILQVIIGFLIYCFILIIIRDEFILENINKVVIKFKEFKNGERI